MCESGGLPNPEDKVRIKPTGHLVKTEYEDFAGKLERVEYSLEGDSTFAISLISLKRDNVKVSKGKLTIGPYRFRIIHLNQPYGEYIVCLDGSKARLLATLYHLTRFSEIIYRRLIITASVWRLAEYHPGYLPGWRDVYLLNKAERKIKQCTRFLTDKFTAIPFLVGLRR